jgi:hypothetical protein
MAAERFGASQASNSLSPVGGENTAADAARRLLVIPPPPTADANGRRGASTSAVVKRRDGWPPGPAPHPSYQLLTANERAAFNTPTLNDGYGGWAASSCLHPDEDEMLAIVAYLTSLDP